MIDYRYETGWQAKTIQRLNALGLGFSFGPGVNWWPTRDGTKIAGPFTTKAEFDRWLDWQEEETRDRS